VDRVADEAVDLAAGQAAERLRVARQDRLAGNLRRPIALMGDADQFVAEAEGAHDLGRRREQGRDSHGSLDAGRACAAAEDPRVRRAV
jgi:hypothetical protein